jgi:predicted transposase/invertase (TIGR01784 family)
MIGGNEIMITSTEHLTIDELNYLKANEGCILNPRMDCTFKAIFTQPTEDSRKALHSFLEAVLDREIDEVKFEPNDAVQMLGTQRSVDYDINVRFSTGEVAEIEMQAWQQTYDYGKRAEYQVSRLLSTHLNKGEPWSKVNKAYQISVLDYEYYPKELSKEEKKKRAKSVLNYYTMKNQNGESLTNILNIVFIELTHLSESYSREELEKLSAAEKWALFLKNADNTNSSELVKNLTEKEGGIMNAQNVLSSISSDMGLWLAQYHAEVRERDRLSNLEETKEQAREEGRAEGREEGREEGRAEGREEGRAEGKIEGMAEGIKNLAALLKSGISLDEAMKKLGQTV